MMSGTYLEILNDYTFKRWILVIITMFVTAVIGAIWFKYTKTNKKVVLLVTLLLIPGFALANVIDLIPVKSDIRNNAVEQVEFSSAYYEPESGGLSYVTTDIRVKPTKGKSFVLKDSQKFPYEMKNGTIIYASRSKIILKYSGTVVREW